MAARGQANAAIYVSLEQDRRPKGHHCYFMTRNILCAGGGQSNYDNVEDVREITML